MDEQHDHTNGRRLRRRRGGKGSRSMRMRPIVLTRLAVLPGLLLLHRCLDLFPFSSERLGCTRQDRRLDPHHLQRSGHAGDKCEYRFAWAYGKEQPLIRLSQSIEKTRLAADSFSYSGNGVAWKARVVLFLGFALMAGGLAGSVVVMVLKYLFMDYALKTMYMGIANVVANALIMLSSVVLWVSQNLEEDYTYNLSL